MRAEQSNPNPHEVKLNTQNNHQDDTPKGDLLVALIALVARFRLGSVCHTSTLEEKVPYMEAMHGLYRHSQCDWGDLTMDDIAENEFSLQNGLRLLSVYTTQTGVKFWIITEADRSLTTILLPEDY